MHTYQIPNHSSPIRDDLRELEVLFEEDTDKENDVVRLPSPIPSKQDKFQQTNAKATKGVLGKIL
jgi:hypothetical protein